MFAVIQSIRCSPLLLHHQSPLIHPVHFLRYRVQHGIVTYFNLLSLFGAYRAYTKLVLKIEQSR